jgi:hypothetical protein
MGFAQLSDARTESLLLTPRLIAVNTAAQNPKTVLTVYLPSL